MNVEPIVTFLWRREAQIKAMFAGGSGPPFPLLAVLKIVVPWAGAKWPALNAKGGCDNGLLDDALATYEAVVAVVPETPLPDRGDSTA